MNDYNDRIRASVASYNFESESTLATNEVTVKGTVYKKGMLVLLGNNDEELQIGKIKLIIVQHDSVYFVSEKHTFVQLRDIGVYCALGVAQQHYVCTKQDNLLDYYPLPDYKMYDMTMVVLHHSFAETV